jgi:hypothetical protein
MTLDEWRIQQNTTYEKIGRLLEISTSKVHRICEKPKQVKLIDAVNITQKIPGITLEDFLK